MVKKILDIGAYPVLDTTCDRIPLHYAAARGSVQVYKVLLEHKSTFNIGVKDKERYTALHYAIIKKHQDMVGLLLRHYKEAGLNEELERARHFEKEVQNGYYL